MRGKEGTDMLEGFTKATFKKGEVFTVLREDDRPVELELVQITAGKQLPGFREPFSLVFKGPKDSLLQQRTYRVDHGSVGSFELFLVPIIPPVSDKGAYYYESIFS